MPLQGRHVVHPLGICYIYAYDGVGMPRIVLMPLQGGHVAHPLGICYIPAYDGAGMPRIVLMPLQGVRSLIVRA